MMRVLRQSIWVVGSLLAVGASAAPAAAQGTVPTFSKDVAPILYENCVVCHRPGESTPMSLLSYDTSRPWARSIKRRVVAREMPPWYADPQYGHFNNDRRLTQQEIDTIAAWVDGGAPKGSDADLPKPPTFATGWLHPEGRQPDAILEMPVEVKWDGAGQVPWTTYYMPVPFGEDKFVEATQVKPSNLAFVHHSVVQVWKPQPGTRIDPVTAHLVTDAGKTLSVRIPQGAPEREGSVGRGRDVFDTSSNVWLAVYAPGWTFERYKPGVGKRIPAGWNFGFSQHYQPTGKPESDRTQLALWYQNVPLQKELITRTIGDAHIADGRQLLDTERGRQVLPNIPPHMDNFSVVGITPVLEPIAVYSFSPHMHLRGKDIKYTAVFPDGREETLMSAPKYDFNWQIYYENAEPVRLPAGTKIVATAHFDNSTKNKHNPAPDEEVFWSDQSWDEMFSAFLQFTKDTPPKKTISRR
jgi:mono/diheme cytochrome c family protein